MDLSAILSLDPNDLHDEEKDKLFNALTDLEDVDDVPKRALRKILVVCLRVIKYKGEQVNALQEQLDTKTQPDSADESRSERLQEENEKLKRMVNKLEEDKNSLKSKTKEMNEEMLHLQRRLAEAMHSAESDKDSSDPLSELDRQEELLKNINTKNKHIKRLLREIEALQTNNIELSKTIIDLEKNRQHAKIQMQDLSSKIVSLESEKTALIESINHSNAELTRLESNITYLEDEREKSENEMKRLIEKLEAKAKSWRSTIDEKDNEIRKLRNKLESFQESTPQDEEEEQEGESIDDNQRVAEELTKLMHAIEVRDKTIEKTEAKIKAMAKEMMSSTQLMNKLSAEREEERMLGSKANRSCCKTIEEALKASNDRCRELSEFLEKSEEDNMLKSQQAAQALASLHAYERGEDGLSKALKRISRLEHKLNDREKHIRGLVTELNAMHEISSENMLLRKKLNIPDDAIITAKNLVAKERNKEKQIERLTLKLRASEEMRLQLKLEKAELRKQLIKLQNTTKTEEMSSDDSTKNTICKSPEKTRPEIYCDNCLKNIQSFPNKETVMQDVVKEWETKYSDVVEENENLRMGMHEILEKIREYNATSEHITIDCEILERLLYALDARSISGWYHPAMRIQNELIALKEREMALREKINSVTKKEQAQYSDESIDEIREAGEIPDSPAPSLPVNPFDSSTRPTTPNRALDQSLYPVIAEADIEHESIKIEFLKTLERNRILQQEIQRLQVFQVHFEELSSQLGASESDLNKYCSVLVDKLSALEIQFNTKNKAFEFLKEDFDRTLTESKALLMRNLTLIADLKKQLNDQRHSINLLTLERDDLMKKASNCNSDEYSQLKKTLLTLQTQVASLVEEILCGKSPALKIDDICIDYGVIQENLELEFITVQEFEDIQREQLLRTTKERDLQMKCDHMESLLMVAKEQVTSQQKLLIDITDNHINLRHLVADLESTSEEKFLIAKIQRELDSAKREISCLRAEKENCEQNELDLKGEIKAKEKELADLAQSFQKHMKNSEIKSKFLQKALLNIRQKFIKFTPLIYLSNFVYAYGKFIKRSREEEDRLQQFLSERVEEILSSKIEASIGGDTTSEDRIKLIKTETRTKFLEDQIRAMNQKNTALQMEMDELRLSIANESEHWKTIEALFGNGNSNTFEEMGVQTDAMEIIDATTNTEEQDESLSQIDSVPKVDKNLSPIASPTRKDPKMQTSSTETQTSPISTTSKQTSPIRTTVKLSKSITESESIQSAETVQQPKVLTQQIFTDNRGIQTSPITSPKHQLSIEENSIAQDLQNKLKEVMDLSDDRAKRLEAAEEGLKEYKKSIEALEKELKEYQEKIQKQKQTESEDKTNYQTGIVEKTILSFHSLLSEKDKSINQYQELLTTERKHNEAVCTKYDKEIESLVNTISELNASIRAKDEEIFELKTKAKTCKESEKEKVEIASGVDDNGDNSLQELSDEKIEEMFNDNEVNNATMKKPAVVSKDIYARELRSKEKFWENTLKVKEEEIMLLKEKLNLSHEKENNESGLNPEIEQLRILLEEKDKHINDMMDTLTNFHDDQQRFLNDSSTYSADQISKLAGNLTRAEATNKIYQAQLEALRRQLANINQREKQARDLNNSLRNQLIKRPVVSIKTELNTRLKTENLQKKITQLETELEESLIQIKRQQVIIDAKRAKSNNEVGLWEKQKRWQQSAEKFKAKLEETEASLEKHKSLLNSARTTIARLEKDKQILETKCGKGCNSIKCCRAPSCPNLQGTKYAASETPDMFTGGSECSTPVRSSQFLGNNHSELIDALKARIELQQRKIIAMEMAGNGSNAITKEIEKLQESYSSIEAQNIRLEARNLQLQLDNDLLRQGDSSERIQKRVKHLEDYIIALKEELAQVEARRQLNFEHKDEKKYAPGQAEQTILSLRSIIEKLRVENKYLKDGRRVSDSKDTATELASLQQMYTESLDKISALQIELQLKARCPNCRSKVSLETFTNEEMQLIKEQLLKKTQLLEKAKILLTRAAAKEKILKEQLSLWKRKCFELQNVPVIDEISE